MKKLILGLASLVLACAHVYGQGQVNFSNRGPGIDAKVVFAGSAIGVSEGFKAQLYAGPVGGALAPVDPTTTFRTGNAAGYVNPIVVTIPGIAAGQQAQIQMRVFEGASFGSSSQIGQSEVITVSLGGGTIVVPNLDGLRGSGPGGTIEVVPEPSTYALGALAFGALLFLRRRK